MKKYQSVSSFACLVCVALLAACSYQSPGSVAKRFFQSMADDDMDAAITMVYWGKVKDNEMIAAKKATMQIWARGIRAQAAAKGGFDSVEIARIERIDDSHARVWFVLHFANGDSDGDHVQMIRSNGKWLLSPL